MAHHRNQSHQPGNQYRNSSRTQSRSITPHIVIQRSDGSRYRYFKQVANNNNVKRSSSQTNEVSKNASHDRDEILYQSSALKDRLLESRYSDGAALCSSENQTLSQEGSGDEEGDILSGDDEGEVNSILSNDEGSNKVVLSKRRENSAKSTITSSQFEEDIKISVLDENETLAQQPIRRQHEPKRPTSQAWNKPGNETTGIRQQQNYRQSSPMDDVLLKKKGDDFDMVMGKIPLDEKPSSKMLASRFTSLLVKKV